MDKGNEAKRVFIDDGKKYTVTIRWGSESYKITIDTDKLQDDLNGLSTTLENCYLPSIEDYSKILEIANRVETPQYTKVYRILAKNAKKAAQERKNSFELLSKADDTGNPKLAETFRALIAGCDKVLNKLRDTPDDKQILVLEDSDGILHV